MNILPQKDRMLETCLLKEWFWSAADLLCFSVFMFLWQEEMATLSGFMCK